MYIGWIGKYFLIVYFLNNLKEWEIDYIINIIKVKRWVK